MFSKHIFLWKCKCCRFGHKKNSTSAGLSLDLAGTLSMKTRNTRVMAATKEDIAIMNIALTKYVYFNI